MDYSSLQTPCYILEEKLLLENYRACQSALESLFTKAHIGISVKTNSLPYLLKLIRNEGGFAEVVSHDEYELALLCGFPGDRIIYNGPLKSKETFLHAINSGAIVNIETWRELEWCSQLPPDIPCKIGLRLNINITRISPTDGHDSDDSRFGFCYENGEFAKALQLIETLPHVSLSGIHLHRTSVTRSLNFYSNLAKYAVEVIKQYHLVLEYIDFGGGFFGIMPGKPTYDEYAKTLAEHINTLPYASSLTVMVEPGSALAASCFSFLTEVVDVKSVDDYYFITTDGSRNDVDPLFRKTDYIKEIIYRNDNRETVEQQIITGCTCLEFDRLFTLRDSKKLQSGDRILYHKVGAYTMCLTPAFIRYIPRVYSIDKEQHIKLVRDRMSANQYYGISTV